MNATWLKANALHSLQYCYLLHGDGSLVFGSHIGEHVRSNPAGTSMLFRRRPQTDMFGEINHTHAEDSLIQTSGTLKEH